MAAGAGTSAAAATAAAAAVRFTPLLGVHGRGPLAYLLELDGFTFLLDCGWNDAYDPALLAPLVAALPRIDAVLLSHSDPCHLGALPYLVGRCGLAAPVYATSPVHKMGQMALYDQYLSRQACSDFDTFNLDDVDAAFALVQPLRYQQNLALSGKGAGILITPFAAGHLLGGSVWRIRKNGEDYVYAPDYNHRPERHGAGGGLPAHLLWFWKERHLNGTVLEAAFQRPALLITGSLNALQVAPDRPNREKELLDAVMGTLRGDGSVLLPIDTAGRLLELVLLLERHWVEHRLTYPLVLLSAMAYSTLEFAKSQLEWMCEALVKNLGHARDNPFATRFLKLCGSREELAHLPRGPKLVLATLPSLESGFSRQLFADWAEEPRNAIIFVTRAEEGTLAEQVQQLGAQQAQQAQQGEAPTLRMLRSHRVPLEGEELEAHLAQQTQQAEQAAQQAQQDADARQQQAAAEAQGPQAMQVDGGPEAAAAAAVAAVDGGTFSPRASAVPRVNSLAIGHLKSFRAGLSGPGSPTALRGEVVGPDGIPVQEYQEAASTAQCLVEGFEVPKGAARPMFPFEDEWEHVAHDEYGASLDYADFDPAEAIGFKALESELQAEAEAEDAGAPPDIPTKVVSATITVTLRARVVRFDFDGLSDGRSMRTILAHVAPRQCILVHGSSEATAALSGHLRQELAGLLTQVYEPQAGEEIELRAEPSYRLALSDELVAGIRLHRIGDYKLGWVEGRVGPPAEGSESQLPQLLPAERADAGAADGGYGGVFIGDVRLSELKQALAAAGIPSEFYAGALYCAGQVVIKRRQPGSGEEPGGDGGLVLEGALSPDYYKIREVVYAQYHIC